MNISFIGFGSMAKAIANGLVAFPDYTIRVAAPSLHQGITANGILTSNNNQEILLDADIAFLAVKPKDMEHVLSEIKLATPNNCLLISVAAGLNLSWLGARCRLGQSIVRSMPNLPISIGEGATPLIANEFVTTTQKNWATELFERVGILTWTQDESDLDRYTALSGSGPAYVFLFLEGMINAAKSLGIPSELAKTFALQTVSGAAHLASQSELELHQLITQVASPKGTTAAALDVFREAKFEKLILNAMQAAAKRAHELSSSIAGKI